MVATKTCAIQGSLQVQIHSTVLLKGGSGLPKSKDSSTNSGGVTSTDGQNGGSVQPLCVDYAAMANYVVDWADRGMNAPCITGDNVYNMSQPVWQVPGLFLSF